jgi:alcohol dehydrogenase class IV
MSPEAPSPGLPSCNWNYPTQVRFGNGRVQELPGICRELGMRHPLIVTDRALGELPVMERVREICRDGALEVEVFSEVDGNPTGHNVSEALRALRAGSCDGVVCLGGGSALDVGKAVALLVGQSAPLWDFEDVGDNWKRVDTRSILPTIAVPTAAGTGSEVGRSSVITNDDAARKVIIFHPSMLPEVALLDPELTVSLPAALTAATGIDALSHSLEAYCARGYHPAAEGIAVEGIRLVHQWLERAFSDPGDLSARGHMLVASMMGATAFQKGLGAMHALSHPLSVHLGQHHGRINAVVMPFVLGYNIDAIDERLTRLAAFLGLGSPSARSFIRWVLALRSQVEIPHTLRDLDMREEHIEAFSAEAAVDPAGSGNPIALGAKGYADLYRHCLSGEIPNFGDLD